MMTSALLQLLLGNLMRGRGGAGGGRGTTPSGTWSDRLAPGVTREGRYTGFLGLGPRETTRTTMDPSVWGGTSTIGRGLGSPEMYGHTFRGRGDNLTPTFSMPGRGGGDVPIPNLAEASMRGDPFARSAIDRQGQSAERMSVIDALIDLMMRGGQPPEDEQTPTPQTSGTYP